MSTLVADCPRCGAARMTHDVGLQVHVETHYSWQKWFEVACICRNCYHSTVFILSQRDSDSDQYTDREGGLVAAIGSLNSFMEVEGFVNLRHQAAQEPPEHLPPNIEAAFKEAATCLAVGCWNAAGTMFRAAVDLGTRPLLPEGEQPGLNARTLNVGGSVGVAIYPAAAKSARRMVRAADQAMYSAKKAGGGAVFAQATAEAAG